MRTRVITGLDGKRYPSGPMAQSERDYVIGRTHYLRHDEHLSVRKIQEYWLYNHALTRSVGSIAAYLARPCNQCSGGHNAAPEQVAVR